MITLPTHINHVIDAPMLDAFCLAYRNSIKPGFLSVPFDGLEIGKHSALLLDSSVPLTSEPIVLAKNQKIRVRTNIFADMYAICKLDSEYKWPVIREYEYETTRDECCIADFFVEPTKSSYGLIVCDGEQYHYNERHLRILENVIHVQQGDTITLNEECYLFQIVGGYQEGSVVNLVFGNEPQRLFTAPEEMDIVVGTEDHTNVMVTVTHIDYSTVTPVAISDPGDKSIEYLNTEDDCKIIIATTQSIAGEYKIFPLVEIKYYAYLEDKDTMVKTAYVEGFVSKIDEDEPDTEDLEQMNENYCVHFKFNACNQIDAISGLPGNGLDVFEDRAKLNLVIYNENHEECWWTKSPAYRALKTKINHLP